MFVVYPYIITCTQTSEIVCTESIRQYLYLDIGKRVLARMSLFLDPTMKQVRTLELYPQFDQNFYHIAFIHRFLSLDLPQGFH